MTAIFVFVAALAAVLPCDSTCPLPGITFDDFQVDRIEASFDRIDVEISTASGAPLGVREIDPCRHHEVFGDRGFRVDEPVILELAGEAYAINVYVGSDTFDPDRFPCLWCFRDGWPLPVGADCGGTTFGPEADIDAGLGGPNDRPFQYLLYHVYPTPFFNYVPAPISWCLLEPNGPDVFVGLVQIDPELGSRRLELQGQRILRRWKEERGLPARR